MKKAKLLPQNAFLSSLRREVAMLPESCYTRYEDLPQKTAGSHRLPAADNRVEKYCASQDSGFSPVIPLSSGDDVRGAALHSRAGRVPENFVRSELQ